MQRLINGAFLAEGLAELVRGLAEMGLAANAAVPPSFTARFHRHTEATEAPTRWMVEMFVENSAKPMMNQFRLRPARK